VWEASFTVHLVTPVPKSGYSCGDVEEGEKEAPVTQSELASSALELDSSSGADNVVVTDIPEHTRGVVSGV
jgi:hypothetical protein